MDLRKMNEIKCYTYHTPPKCLSEIIELMIDVLFDEIHGKRCEYKAQESYVQCRYQLLQVIQNKFT